jgi:predicted acylesterase/phospholipase RssA
MKHILSCDGGGIRGVFTLQVIQRIEELLRAHTGNPELVLADHYDFFAGTSTGAIIATCLCRGMTSRQILDFYTEGARKMFSAAALDKRYILAKYDSMPLSLQLKNVFVEPDGKTLSDLGSETLRKLLLVVTRNATTGSPWPITNNKNAKYNDRSLPYCNLRIPLWQLVRASTAAPTYFPAETIMLGEGQKFVFVDGAITAYNNPALIAAQTAVLPAYRINWPPGPDRIRVISVGTLRFASAAARLSAEQLGWFHAAKNVPKNLMDTSALQQDMICRTMGKCLFGAEIDAEVGTMTEDDGLPKMFSYVRYNKSYRTSDIVELEAKYGRNITELDSVDSISALKEIGAEYAAENVRLEHLISPDAAAACISPDSSSVGPSQHPQ